jgi:hypothetical protein
VPGYWHHEAAAYHWIAGFWRVPASDVVKKLTFRAPRPPPPARKAEARPSRPAVSAVWAPGHWQWNGRAYVWVDGAWRIPPSRRHDWQPDAWITIGGEALFSPGGWKIRLGR